MPGLDGGVTVRASRGWRDDVVVVKDGFWLSTLSTVPAESTAFSAADVQRSLPALFGRDRSAYAVRLKGQRNIIKLLDLNLKCGKKVEE